VPLLIEAARAYLVERRGAMRESDGENVQLAEELIRRLRGES
jgi:hypothetical protein